MKRPDLSERNRTNNPMHNEVSREKMRQTLTGRKLSISTRQKMSASRKARLKANPELLDKMLIGAEKKYLSKVRGTGWTKVRLKALERDNFKCQVCGSSEKLQVHHIDHKGKNMPSQTLMNNDLDNLITLCISCHGSYHSKQRWHGIAP